MKKAALFALLPLFLVFVAGVLFFALPRLEAPPSENVAFDPAEDDADRRPIYSLIQNALPIASKRQSCDGLSRLRARLGDSAEISLWTESESANFVHYDPAQHELHVCHQGRSFSGKWGAPEPEIAEMENDLIVSVGEARMGDWFQDGRIWFFAFQGQCVEGPCLGDWNVFSLEEDSIMWRGRFEVDEVQLVEEGGKRAFATERRCYDPQLVSLLSVLSMAEAGPDGKITPISALHIRTRFPKTLAAYEKSLAALPEGSRALRDVRALFPRSYRGESPKRLVREYRAIVKSLENQSLGISCNPATLLEWIASN